MMMMFCRFPHASALLSLLLIIVNVQMSTARLEKRLGSSFISSEATALDTSLEDETNIIWGRLLGEDSISSMSMPPTTPSPTPKMTSPPTSTKKRTLLALGDSLCAGQLPEPKNEIFFSDQAYVDTLFEYLQDNFEFDDLQKICCSGEDSYELINGRDIDPDENSFSDGSFCYGGPNDTFSSQLDAAVATLQSGAEVDLITISIGANDILRCSSSPNPEECAAAQIGSLVVNLQTILTTLTEATTTPTPIIALTPYNPTLALLLSDIEQERAIVPLSIQAIVGLQTEATKVYNAFGVPVVFGNEVFDGLNNELVNGIPQNAVNICKYVGMCDETESGSFVLKSPELRDIHPYPEGYEKLGIAHFDTLDGLL